MIRLTSFNDAQKQYSNRLGTILKIFTVSSSGYILLWLLYKYEPFGPPRHLHEDFKNHVLPSQIVNVYTPIVQSKQSKAVLYLVLL